MAVRLVAVSFDVRAPDEVAAFWAGMLDRDVVGELGGVLVPGDDTQVGLRFVQADGQKSGPNRVHLHLTSSTRAEQERTVDKALRLGANHIDVGQPDDASDTVLADPGGNEFCVIEPHNGFLAGCGLLGEVTCEGPPQVGRFWRDALGWPMVWDRDPQTAIQSPRGGTKVSWDVRPGQPRYGNARQRFDLAAADLATDVERLVELGASERGSSHDRIVLTAPDGSEFTVCRETPRHERVRR